MTSQEFIEENKTESLEEGDTVVMHTCAIARRYNGKLWKCKTNSYEDAAGQEMIFLEDFSGNFSVEFLQKVKA